MAADVAGLNYQSASYAKFHQTYPDKPVLSPEDGSAVMTRGEYETDHKKRFVIDSDDTQWQPWGRNQRTSWRQIDEQPFMAGGFVWTGFDYRGEPQPLDWPGAQVHRLESWTNAVSRNPRFTFAKPCGSKTSRFCR
jgi:beta-galactosidase